MQLLRKILFLFSFTFSFGVVMAQNETETLVQTLQTANFSNLLSFWDAASEVNILDQSSQKQVTPAQANQLLQLFFSNKNIIISKYYPKQLLSFLYNVQKIQKL